MIEIIVRPGEQIDLGRQGENRARRIVFDVAQWEQLFGEGTVYLLHQRKGDEAPYPVAVERERNKVYWLVGSADVACPGSGRLELQYRKEDVIVKSEEFHTKTWHSLDEAGEHPGDPEAGWVEQVLASAQRAKESADQAETAETTAKNSETAAQAAAEQAAEAQRLAEEAAERAETAAGQGGSTGGGVGQAVENGGEIFNDYENNTAAGEHSHAEGSNTTASGMYSHAEGQVASARGDFSHAEGRFATTDGNAAHAEGDHTYAKAHYSHAEGYYTMASGEGQHVQGKANVEDTENKYAHIVGNGVNGAKRSNAHTIDWTGLGWFAGGIKVGGTSQDDEVAKSVLLAGDAVPVPESAAVGQVIAVKAVDENGVPTEWKTVAKGVGFASNSNGAEVFNDYGGANMANGKCSHAEGFGSYAMSEYQHVQGKCNIIDVKNKYAHIVGNGTSTINAERSNAHTLDWDGLGWFKGGLKVGGTGQDDPNAKTVATLEDLQNVGGGSVTSWNDLEDRPFGETKQTVEVLAECTCESAGASDGMNVFTYEGTVPVTAGETYTVNWNGVEYDCVAVEIGDSVALGNLAVIGAGDDTGEPFLIPVIPDDPNFEFYGNDGSTSVTLSIKQEQTVVTPLPVKYLPEGYPYVEEGEEKEVFPETTLTITDGQAIIPNAVDVAVGGIYTVTWNGVEYKCIGLSQEMDGVVMPALGDPTMSGNGEPFFMVFIPAELVASAGAGGVIQSFDGTVTLSIKGKSAIVHTMDEKFLPNIGTPTIYLADYGITELIADADPQEVYLEADAMNTVAKAMDTGRLFIYCPLSDGIDNIDGTLTIGGGGGITRCVFDVFGQAGTYFCHSYLPNGKRIRVELIGNKLIVAYLSA